MPHDDAWDWPLLLYTATVMLHRTDRQFWCMTPRKLNALTKAHIAMNPRGGGNDKEQAKRGYVDQIY